ncbi:hypothetical protein FLAN108750_13575 [Flavobacterium antarcticum]
MLNQVAVTYTDLLTSLYIVKRSVPMPFKMLLTIVDN